jgi:uncharacterized protein YbjT (DUF2867 family)
MLEFIHSIRMRILVTGVTGYIGGRLVPLLLEEGTQIRCLVRDPSRLEGRSWTDQVEIIQGDIFDLPSLFNALQDVKIAYYLIHSMGGGSNFHNLDIIAAENFSYAAKKQGVERIIYLGGLGDPTEQLSTHLQSRQITGERLGVSGIPVTELRAAVIVGSGSLSFEMIRYLTERLPVMICPKWVYTRVQPIAIRNVLDYLVSVKEIPAASGRVIEIGGSDVLTYGEMMMIYARVRGLKRWLIPVPVLTPRLSSYWVHIITPIPSNIARPLIEGLKNEVIVKDNFAREILPEIKLLDYETSVKAALEKLQAGEVETVWSDALVTTQGTVKPVVLTTVEGMTIEKRQLIVSASPETIYKIFSGLGGKRGWLYMNWAWQIRGLIDRIAGGVGMRRGRRDPENVRIGDALDFWRVEEVEYNSLLRLRAEMKVPGKAWLQFSVTQHLKDKSLLTQTAFFAPKGLAGWVYWYALYPIHSLIFSGMIRRISQLSELEEDENGRKGYPDL